MQTSHPCLHSSLAPHSHSARGSCSSPPPPPLPLHNYHHHETLTHHAPLLPLTPCALQFQWIQTGWHIKCGGLVVLMKQSYSAPLSLSELWMLDLKALIVVLSSMVLEQLRAWQELRRCLPAYHIQLGATELCSIVVGALSIYSLLKPIAFFSALCPSTHIRVARTEWVFMSQDGEPVARHLTWTL